MSFCVPRGALYALLFVFSVILLGLTSYRTWYTRRLSSPDILTTRQHFYNPIVIELLVTSILALILSIFLLVFLCIPGAGRAIDLIDIGCLSILFIMFLVGAAIFTSDFSNLKWCRSSFKVCRVLESIKAISWICWVLVFFLLALAIASFFRRRSAGRTTRGAAAGAAGATAASQPETRTAGTTQPVTGGQQYGSGQPVTGGQQYSSGQQYGSDQPVSGGGQQYGSGPYSSGQPIAGTQV